MQIIFVLFIGIFIETTSQTLWISEKTNKFPPLKYQTCPLQQQHYLQQSLDHESYKIPLIYQEQQSFDEPPRLIKLKQSLWKFYKKFWIPYRIRQQFSYGCVYEIDTQQNISFSNWLINRTQQAKNYLFQLKQNITRSIDSLYISFSTKNNSSKQPYNYTNNYAALYGGAKILMKSFREIHQCSSILKNQLDQYLYTDQQLPFSFVISLSEEIAIEEVTLKSSQIYSKIVKEFLVQGSFAWQNNVWTYLGTYTAENNFQQQKFDTRKKIVRYIRVTILSAYGKWRYFTLTQIKVHGKSMFVDALLQADDTKNNLQKDLNATISNTTKNNNTMYIKQQRQSQQQQIIPHDTNLIGQLFNHLDQLKKKNENQKEQIVNLNNKLGQFSQILIQQQNNTSFYFYISGLTVFLSLITAVILIAICLLRKENLVSSKKSTRKKPRNLLTIEQQQQ